MPFAPSRGALEFCLSDQHDSATLGDQHVGQYLLGESVRSHMILCPGKWTGFFHVLDSDSDRFCVTWHDS